jgi:stage II sporulation protein D
VARITIALGHGAVEVDGPAVRSVLRPVGETTLRSAAFVLTQTREGGVLRTLVADGRGAGHAVGFCQWGAVGRARGGQDAATILGAYFPGTVLSRAY